VVKATEGWAADGDGGAEVALDNFVIKAVEADAIEKTKAEEELVRMFGFEALVMPMVADAMTSVGTTIWVVSTVTVAVTVCTSVVANKVAGVLACCGVAATPVNMTSSAIIMKVSISILTWFIS